MKQVKLLFSIIFSFITVVCFGQLMPLADEAVTLNTQNGAIHGKILLPPGMKSSPVVLLIAGSGPTDMDGNSAIGQMTNNSLKYLAEDLAEQGIINDSLKQGKLVPNVPFGMEALFRQSVQPYMISWYKYNPQQVIKELKIPVLIVQGKNDIQVLVEDAELLKKAAPSATLLLIEKMNHVLKDCDTTDPQKQMAVYANPSLPVNATLISSLSSFIKEKK